MEDPENIEDEERLEGKIVTCKDELANTKLIQDSVEYLVSFVDEFCLDIDVTKDSKLRKCLIMELDEVKKISEILRKKDKDNEAIYDFIDSLYRTYTQYLGSRFDEPEFDELYLKINDKMKSMLDKGKINFKRNSEFLNYVKNEVAILNKNKSWAKKSKY